ncbi:unnamed protein product [Candida verbasci]|uniref:Inhibitor I9 domain-containing protein n=1 Tax=Candida verbasci TaxID=1227364 RepID=A0A9W4TZS6_9ASCO|nr:unnamed protein product [Candida verbasci]
MNNSNLKKFIILLISVSLISFIILNYTKYSISFKTNKTNKTDKTNIMAEGKGYIVTLKEDATDGEVNSIKDKVKELGGKITNEFSLIKGFSVHLPDIISAESLGKHSDKIANVEEDKEVHTQ